MRQQPRSPLVQYALLALVAACGLIHVALGVRSSFGNLVSGQNLTYPPFSIELTAKAIPLSERQAASAGAPSGFVLYTLTSVEGSEKSNALHVGDAIYTVDGLPFTGQVGLFRTLARHGPGDSLDLTIWRAGTSLDAHPVRLKAPLRAQRRIPSSAWIWLVQSVFTLLPIFCLLTGLYVVLARPRSTNAWLILGILGYFSAFFLHSGQEVSILLPASLLWNTFGQTAMSVCFLLFGIYFPTRAAFDIRYPWVKWLLILPTLAFLPFDLLYQFAFNYRLSAMWWLQGSLSRISVIENALASLQIFASFFFFSAKLSNPATPPDAWRRLKVLVVGSSIGLTPLFVLVILAALRGTEMSAAAPQWIKLTIYALLFVFPLTLAYVVIVQRAVDVRILLRQGTKYFFARQSVLVVGILLAIWMSRELSSFFSSQGHRRTVDIVRIFGIVAIFFVYRTITARRLQERIDRRFFREAYSTEQILSELSDEARSFTETTPLLETITQRLSSTLHIDRIAVFLRTGEVFQLQFATGLALSPGHLPALAAGSATIANLTRGRSAPANVYRDDPSSWLVDATAAERTALADLSTELLVPLPGRNRLVGVIALGPKRSEEPYSKADRQLLQSVASQTGLALENAELLESLTTELAQKARATREAEIAREVQERLFPQVYPAIAGIDLCGFCRPAYFVGGDYYDFFLIPEVVMGAHRLAIAIGDISGKGVSAALLMASLRASLRSVATIPQAEVAENVRLATLMQHVNRLVYEASTSNRYATFFYAELDPATRMLAYVNAGHNCPIILRGGEAIQLQPTGTVIGLLPDAVYDQATVQLERGDTLLAFTDGISEAMTATDEEWGEDRMVAAAQRLLSQPGYTRTAKHLLESLLAEADAFTAGAPQHDDMTILVTFLC